MKTITIIIFSFICINLYAVEINSLTGPSTISCSTDQTEYTVNYTLLPPIFGQPYDKLTEVRWDFILNGSVVKTIFSSGFSQYGFKESTKIIVKDLPIGDITIKVKLSGFTIYAFTPIPIPQVPFSKSKSKLISVGLNLTSISGLQNICPGSTSSFSVTPISNASSYTWEVPSDWLVNGIAGPVISGQGSSVNITVPGCASLPIAQFPNSQAISYCYAPYYATIKVKALSENCGESNYSTKYVAVDYPFNVSHYESSNETVTFTAYPYGFPSYSWSFPTYWTSNNTNSYNAVVYHNGQPGNAVLTVKTYCNNFYSTTYSFTPSGSDCSQPYTTIYPNPASSDLIIDPPCLTEISAISVEENGSFSSLQITQEGDRYKTDVSKLSPGIHILRIKNSKGEEQTVRLIKSQ